MIAHRGLDYLTGKHSVSEDLHNVGQAIVHPIDNFAKPVAHELAPYMTEIGSGAGGLAGMGFGPVGMIGGGILGAHLGKSAGEAMGEWAMTDAERAERANQQRRAGEMNQMINEREAQNKAAMGPHPYNPNSMQDVFARRRSEEQARVQSQQPGAYNGQNASNNPQGQQSTQSMAPQGAQQAGRMPYVMGFNRPMQVQPQPQQQAQGGPIGGYYNAGGGVWKR